MSVNTIRKARIAEWRPEGWNDAVAVANSQEMGFWVFRGQNDASHRLESSFERGANDQGFPGARWQEAEKYIIEDFQRHIHQHMPHERMPDNELDWLALIRHHGGPTRLLDVSASFYVASFFATENASRDRDAAVWAFNINHFRKWKASASKEDSKPIGEVCRKERELVNRSLRRLTDKQGIYHVQPYRLSERMIMQQGAFLYPRDIATPFMQNLAQALRVQEEVFSHMETIDGDCLMGNMSDFGLVKIVFDPSQFDEIRGGLRRMNISSATLYPGLDGFARSLYYPFMVFGKCRKTKRA